MERRKLVVGKGKLKVFKDVSFLTPDEPLPWSRKQTVDRLRTRAENEGKTVSVLSLNVIEVFSLSQVL